MLDLSNIFNKDMKKSNYVQRKTRRNVKGYTRSLKGI